MYCRSNIYGIAVYGLTFCVNPSQTYRIPDDRLLQIMLFVLPFVPRAGESEECVKLLKCTVWVELKGVGRRSDDCMLQHQLAPPFVGLPRTRRVNCPLH